MFIFISMDILKSEINRTFPFITYLQMMKNHIKF